MYKFLSNILEHIHFQQMTRLIKCYVLVRVSKLLNSIVKSAVMKKNKIQIYSPPKNETAS